MNDTCTTCDVEKFCDYEQKPKACCNQRIFKEMSVAKRVLTYFKFKEKLKKFGQDLRDLKDNWDGYGARKPTEAAINNTTEFVKILFTKEIPIYYSFISGDGDILIELKNDDYAAEIYFMADSTTEVFIYEFGDICISEGKLDNLMTELFDKFKIQENAHDNK